MAVSRWLHLQESTGMFWALHIIGAADAAYSRKAFKRLGKLERELGLYIRIKLTIIQRITRRLVNQKNRLFDLVSTHNEEDVFTLDKEGFAFPVDENLKYDLICDIELLMFEVLSCWQITKRFVSHIHRHIGKKFPKKQINFEISNILTENEQSVSWMSLLEGHRNFMSHIGGVYLAVDISNAEIAEWDLLIMKSNIKNFDNKDEYIPFSELISICIDFSDSMDILQKHLIGLFEAPSSAANLDKS